MNVVATFGNIKQTNKFPSISWSNLNGILQKDSSSGGGFVVGNAATSKSVRTGTNQFTTEDIILRSGADTGSSYVLRTLSVETNARAQVEPLNGSLATAEIVFTIRSRDPRTNNVWLGNILLSNNFVVRRATFNPNLVGFGLEDGIEIAATVRAPSSFTTAIDYLDITAEFEFTGSSGILAPLTVTIAINDVEAVSQSSELTPQSIIIEQGTLLGQPGVFVELDELDIDVIIENLGTNIIETANLTQQDLIVQLGDFILVDGSFGALPEQDLTIIQGDITTEIDIRAELTPQTIELQQGSFAGQVGFFGELTDLDIEIGIGEIQTINPESVMGPPDFDPNDPDAFDEYASAITNFFEIIIDSDTVGITLFDDGITVTNDWMLFNGSEVSSFSIFATNNATFDDSALEIWMDWDAGQSSGTFDSFEMVTSNTASEFETPPFGTILNFDRDIRYNDIPAVGMGGPWMSWHNHPRPLFKNIAVGGSALNTFAGTPGPGDAWFLGGNFVTVSHFSIDTINTATEDTEHESTNIKDYFVDFRYTDVPVSADNPNPWMSWINLPRYIITELETDEDATHDPQFSSPNEKDYFIDFRYTDVPVSADNPNPWMSWINLPRYVNINFELLGTSAQSSAESFEKDWMGWDNTRLDSLIDIIIATSNTATEDTSAENFNVFDFKSDVRYEGIPLSAIDPSANPWMGWINQPQLFDVRINVDDEGVSDPNQPVGNQLNFKFDIDYDGVPVSADQFNLWMGWDNQPQGFPINLNASNTAQFGFALTFVSSIWVDWDTTEDSSTFILTQLPVFESYDMELLGNDQFLTVYTTSSALKSVGFKVSANTIDITAEINSSPRGISPYILNTDVPSKAVIGFYDITLGNIFSPAYNFISYGVGLSNLTSITTASSTSTVDNVKIGVNTTPTEAFEYRVFDSEINIRSIGIDGNAETITIDGQASFGINETVEDIERIGNSNAVIKFEGDSGIIYRGETGATPTLSSFITNIPEVAGFVNINQNNSFLTIYQDEINGSILKFKRFTNSSSGITELTESEIDDSISFGDITRIEAIQLSAYSFMVFARSATDDIHSIVFTLDTEFNETGDTAGWYQIATSAADNKMIARKMAGSDKISLIFKHKSDHLAIKVISL